MRKANARARTIGVCSSATARIARMQAPPAARRRRRATAPRWRPCERRSVPIPDWRCPPMMARRRIKRFSSDAKAAKSAKSAKELLLTWWVDDDVGNARAGELRLVPRRSALLVRKAVHVHGLARRRQ